jgi:hypothetical protein
MKALIHFRCLRCARCSMQHSSLRTWVPTDNEGERGERCQDDKSEAAMGFVDRCLRRTLRDNEWAAFDRVEPRCGKCTAAYFY